MELITLYEANVSDVRIRDFVEIYQKGGLTYPLYQRYDKWSKAYKRTFIKSLLEGKDIPKIYTCEVDNEEDEMVEKRHILDGGHRSRAIVEYIDGNFSILLNDGNWYKFSDEGTRESLPRGTATSQTRVLPQILKKRLLNTQLQIVTYQGLDEIESRRIFNELNHSRPMTIPEIVNSHSSLLVEQIRALSSTPLIQDLVKRIPRFKVANHEYFKFMVAMFSITERTGDEAYKFCEPASLVRYVRGDGTPDEKGKETNNSQFTEDQMEVLYPRFTQALERFKDVIVYLDPVRVQEIGDAYSLFQYVFHNREREVEGDLGPFLQSFMATVYAYKNQEKHLEKIINNVSSSVDTVSQKKLELDQLRGETGPHIVDWAATTKNNPCGPSNMRVRQQILRNL